MSDRTSPGEVDTEALDALREGVAAVLAEQSGSTAIHAFIDGKRALDRELWAQAGTLGWLGFGIAEQYGGLGLGARGLAILHGELGRYAAPGPYIASLSAAQAIAESADDAAKTEWLPRLVSGAISAAVPAHPAATTLALNGGGRVSGEVRCLGDREAAVLLAPAGGSTWVLVELGGTEITPVAMWDRTRELIDIRLTGTKPAAIIEGGAVEAALLRCLALATAADSAGAARSITERTLDYMKTREQFGRPIASFQALKHRAADLVTKLAVMDEIVAHAVEQSGEDNPDADMWAALAKAEATEAACFICTDCLQLHGGVGFTWDFDPHIFLKRARLNEMLVMANPALRDRAAAGLATATRAGRTPLELPL